MKLIYLNEELDTDLEYELLSKNEFGFEVLIEYTENSWYLIKKIQLNNCTKVHWRFTNIFNLEPYAKVAFESDIHSTGFNREIKTIKSIEIKYSNKIEKKYIDYKNEIQKQSNKTIFSKTKKILTF